MGKTGQFKTIGRTAIVAAMLIAAWAPMVVDAQRDRGLNQPGATGNRAGVRDPGVNQPGAVGNRGGVDPGFNQPGVVGNVGYAGSARQVRAVSDPGINQPGAVGNYGRDPGLNQPGATGNRR